MTTRPLALVALSFAVFTTGCTTPWREDASTAATGCPASDIVISQATAGSLNNTWKARCGERTWACTVPASAEYYAPASCTLESGPAVATPANAAPAVVPLATPASGLEDKLATLKRAHDQGLLTDAEYAAKKKALLDAY